MNRETRIESYRKIYAHLKEKKGLTGFNYSDEQKNLEFEFEGGPFHFHYCLFVNTDRVQIRAVMKTDMDEEKASMIAKEISSKMEGMSGTSYDKQIILQSNVIFFGVSDQEAAKMIYDKTCKFVEVVMDYVEKEFPGYKIKNEQMSSSDGNEEMQVEDGVQSAADTVSEEEETKDETSDSVEEEPLAGNTDKGDHTHGQKQEKIPSNDKWADDIFSQVSHSFSAAARNDVAQGTFGKADASVPSVGPVEVQEDAIEVDTSELSEKADLDAPLEAPVNAPEDIRKMYEEMNSTFLLRKEQLDYSDQLIKKQKAYIKAEKEQLLKERQELEAQKKEVEEQESKLKSKWSNYNSAKKNQMERESALAEREARTRVLSEKINEKQTTLDGLVESNRMQKDELERLRIKTHEQREMLEEEKAVLEGDKKDLEAQRTKLHEQAEELSAKEQKLRLMESQLAMRDKAIRDKMSDLKEMEDMARRMQLPGYKPDPEAMKSLAVGGKEREDLLKRIQGLENELKEERKHKQSVSETIDEKVTIEKARDEAQKENEDLKEMCAALEKENAELKAEISSRETQYNRNVASIAAFEKDATTLKERAERAEKQNEELQAEIKELREKVAEDTILIDKAKKRIDILKNENALCIDDLENTGYHMEEVQGEGDQLFRGTKDDAVFYVNRKVKVLYVEKPAKSKNQRMLSDWNGEDMRFSYAYSLSEKKATCRCVYTNVVEDLGTILTKFDELK